VRKDCTVLSPWFTSATSLTAVTVSAAALLISLYRWRGERRDAIPAFVVHTDVWYGEDPDDDDYELISRVDVVAINVSTVSATVISVSASPIDGYGWFSAYEERHKIVPSHESLRVVLTEDDLSPVPYGSMFGRGDPPSEVWMRVNVEGFGHSGRRTAWFSSPFVLRRKLDL
jgi:hypothetical protein